MPPSIKFVREEYRGEFIQEMLNMVEDAERAEDPDLCDFVVYIPGLSADRTQDEVIACNNPATTFCGRCKIALCQPHAKTFALEVYCPNCVRSARAEMLPILHGEA